MARGAKRVWFAKGAKAEAWALNHVAASHDWPLWHLARLVFEVPDGLLCKTGRPGILWTPYDIPWAPLSVARLVSTGITGDAIRVPCGS